MLPTSSLVVERATQNTRDTQNSIVRIRLRAAQIIGLTAGAQSARPDRARWIDDLGTKKTVRQDNDYQLTRRLVDAGKLVGVEVLDHIIVGDGRYYSFRERCRM